MNTHLTLRIVLTALCTSLATQAKADFTYNIAGNYTSGSSGQDLEVLNLKIDGHDENGLVGAIHLNPSGAHPGPSSIVTVCADIQGILWLGSTYNFTEVPFSQSGSGRAPTWGFQSTDASSALQNAAYVYYHNQNLLNSGTVSQKASVQLAVWAALYNTGNSAGLSVTNSTGRFIASGDQAAIDGANAILSSLPTSFTSYTGFLLQANPAIQNGNTAQQLFAPVPEPSTILAGVLLLAPMGISLARRRRA